MIQSLGTVAGTVAVAGTGAVARPDIQSVMDDDQTNGTRRIGHGNSV